VSIGISFSHEIIINDFKHFSHIVDLRRVFISFNLENTRYGDALEIGSVSAMQSADTMRGKYFSILICYILQIAHV